MYNSETPSRAELPSSKQLLRSTVLAAVSAVVLLVAVVLPAEYGIDPTGVGRVLRLTDMGEIKTQLAAEAAADTAAASGNSVVTSAQAQQPPPGARSAPTPAFAPAAKPAVQEAPWRDEMTVTLTPGEGTEIKMRMTEGAKADYSWVVQGGRVNFDTHGDGGGKNISYEKGRDVPADDGQLVAAFTGNHGWYWRNRGKADVKLVLRTRGEYTDIKRAM
ncbi:transmembrane anchor protein [Hydrogenophaga laconesensis]|jgi:hypothetical protein|uniref:Transmembrane anchor protein n=1 Tax=Hydrogenophaga laconesensis TaxID=1805971 RepID=A0ABU1VI76_9BURK|nr:transmembrane anchor protein [Hydrogenophaga laconesensis]MDR7097197.1 hypothetical protein [Hydrogenophaga laconesensis]